MTLHFYNWSLKVIYWCTLNFKVFLMNFVHFRFGEQSGRSDDPFFEFRTSYSRQEHKKYKFENVTK